MSPSKDSLRTPSGVEAEVRRLPELQVVARLCPNSSYLVGGAVRDLLEGRPVFDLDVAVEGEVGPPASALGGVVTMHERFGTASVELPDGRTMDLARTRTESYPTPGALPEVYPAPIGEDLGRRDFSVNAMAIPLSDPSSLLDPFGGVGDLDKGIIRVLHPRSLEDDPTRAFRAVRYCSRFGFALDPDTRQQIDSVDLDGISTERIEAEVSALAAEECSTGSLRLAADLGLVEADAKVLEVVCRLFDHPGWKAYAASCGLRPEDVLAEAVVWPGREVRTLEAAQDLARIHPSSAGEIRREAGSHSPVEIFLARAVGAAWLDAWCERIMAVSPSITGEDLIAAGAHPGPAIGAGLAKALDAKLEEPEMTPERELEIALAEYRRYVAGEQEGL